MKSIKGKVVEGAKIGRTIGFPTANIHFQSSIYKLGVYFVRTIILDSTFYGIMNLGYKPTISKGNHQELSCEVHLFNFNNDIYGIEIEIEMIKFLRNEMQFETIHQLKKQIHEDVLTCKKLIGNYSFLTF